MSTSPKRFSTAILIIALITGGICAVFAALLLPVEPPMAAEINDRFAAVLASTPPAGSPPLHSPRENKPPTAVPARPEKKNRLRATRSPAATNDAGPIECPAYGVCLIDRQLFFDALRSPSSVLSGVQVFPENRSGRQNGYRLGALSNKHLRALGLRTGDTLTAVNGIALSSGAGVSRALAQAAKSDQYRLDIQRDEEKLSFYYRLR